MEYPHVRRFRHLPIAVAFFTLGLGLLAVAPPPQRGASLVSSDHRLASDAGAEILAKGGNAIDAAVATALAAGVVQPAGSGLGGGGFAIVVQSGEAPYALDFRETAPAAATRDMYRTEDGGVHDTASRKGGLSVGIPGEGRGLAKLLAQRGTMTPADVAAPAIRLASRGFSLGPHLAGSLERTKSAEVRALFGVGEAAPRPGTSIKRVALGKTLKKWASSGGDYLYTGPGAESIAATVQDRGGILTAADLAAYSTRDRKPVIAKYKGYTLVTMPLPSSGGVVLGQMLGVLEAYDLPALGHNSSEYIHLLSEVMKHAYADRARQMGDPDFVDVPVDRLMSGERIADVRRKILPTRTFDAEYYGELAEPAKDAGTQHISVIDSNGNAVALTTTINLSFGSGVVDEQTGIILNDEMDDFTAAPGVPNAFGLVGQEANAVEPGKRPLSSMTPTVVLDADGKVVMSIGASGGSFIITSVMQTFLNISEFGMDPQEAVAAPRFHHQWQPNHIFLETDGFPVDVRRSLESRGHALYDLGRFSACQVVRVGENGLDGGADPSKGGWPAGIW